MGFLRVRPDLPLGLMVLRGMAPMVAAMVLVPVHLLMNMEMAVGGSTSGATIFFQLRGLVPWALFMGTMAGFLAPYFVMVVPVPAVQTIISALFWMGMVGSMILCVLGVIFPPFVERIEEPFLV